MLKNMTIDEAGFYLTYEELKHKYIKRAPTLEYGFYLTYEELKHITFVDNIQYQNRFYLTYEELKPIYCLPVFKQLIAILSYLWGIETVKKGTFASSPIAILSYLWGIETAFTYIGNFFPCIDFILPMRNWNKPSNDPKTVASADFILPMRNWN